jgi:hypothetical protein
MSKRQNLGIIFVASVWIALMLDGVAAAAPKRLIAKAYCECGCVREHEGNGGEIISENLGTKKFEAPGGDAQSCSGQNGTACRSGGVEGKLVNCSGYVERGDLGGIRIPDITITPDLQIAPAQ